jgi:CHAD domain-containing protein
MRPVARPGFVVADEMAPDLDELLTGVRSALSAAFMVKRASSLQRISRTWLDTFDWRLYRAGLTLEYRAGELILTGGSTGDTELTQRTPGWRPAVRGVARPGGTNLPAGTVASRIAPLIAPRALLPVATVRSILTTLALLNSDGKTVARVEFDVPQAPAPRDAGAPPAGAPPAGPLPPPRLTITEVRGYSAQARRAEALLAAAPGIEAATASPFESAAADRRPGEYTGKVEAPIEPDQPAPVAVAIVLLNLLDTLEANVDGVLRDVDIEFLHDLRVSVRRTRSALKLLGDALPVDTEHFRTEFKWLGDITTPVRDLDVHLEEFEETARTAYAATLDDFEPVRAYLQRSRAAQFRRLTRELRSPRFTGLLADWRKVLVEVRTLPARTGRPRRALRPAGPTARRTQTARALATRKTRAAHAKLLTMGAAITQDSPPEPLHDLRKRAKELRYALEFFSPLYLPDDYGKALGDLKKLQDCLGEYQDTHVQTEEIRQQADAMLADRAHPVTAATLLAMGEIIAGLAQRQQTARDDFERRFAVFAGPAGRSRFSRLFQDSATDES